MQSRDEKNKMEEIYQKYAQTVYKYLLSLTRDSQLAEELTQETFYQAVKSIGRYDGSCSVSTWLCAIAKHQLSAWRRKNPETESLERRSPGSSQNPDGERIVGRGDFAGKRRSSRPDAAAAFLPGTRPGGAVPANLRQPVLPRDRGNHGKDGELGAGDVLQGERAFEKGAGGV